MQGFSVPIAHLLGRPGDYKDIELSAVLTGVGTSLATVCNEPVTGRLRLESVVEGILVTGELEATTMVRCSRCLEATKAGLATRVLEMFVAPGHEDAAEDDSYRITGMELDLEPMVRDAIGLALPINPLCRIDCRGICAGCGTNLNEGVCVCSRDDVDPRWAPLSGLAEKLAHQS